ncbi:MAG: DUF4783 domain-containing protein [Bacteroidetes bacterium]|nr:DUF4783 domain-containing protein [Bacteroidota bacterium]
MNKSYFILAGLLFLSINCFSQDAVKSDISAALKAGDASKMTEHLHVTVDLNTPGINNAVSKNQAIQILKDFFDKNPPSSYTRNHEGSSKDGSVYIIGTYLTTGATNYRTYFLLKKFDGQFRIVQIQFEEQ